MLLKLLPVLLLLMSLKNQHVHAAELLVLLLHCCCWCCCCCQHVWPAVSQITSLSPGFGNGTSSTSATSLNDRPVRFATSLLHVAGSFAACCTAAAGAVPLVLASAWVCTLWTSQLADIERRDNISSFNNSMRPAR
jgi:hypothetical protein